VYICVCVCVIWVKSTAVLVCYADVVCSRGQLHFSCQNHQHQAPYRPLATSRLPSILSFDQSQLTKWVTYSQSPVAVTYLILQKMSHVKSNLLTWQRLLCTVLALARWQKLLTCVHVGTARKCNASGINRFKVTVPKKDNQSSC